MRQLDIAPGIVIPAHDLWWTAARSSGAGGQNVNKVASKVDLRFDLVRTTAIDAATVARLRALAGRRVTAAGELVVVSQRTRDQAQNLEDARDKLRALVRAALEMPRPRRLVAAPRVMAAARKLLKRRAACRRADRVVDAE